MENNGPIRLLPTMPMLADSLEQAGFSCRMHISEEKRSYRGIRLYHRQQVLQEDVLYLLRPTEREFPFDTHSYLSSGDLPGRANHLVCPQRPDEEILDRLMEVFSQFRSWEESIDLLLYRNATLQELCELGERLLENPVCIHDDWFVMTAMSSQFPQVMEPEYLISSARGFVPRAVVEDFRYDSDYLETYRYHDAQIWHGPQRHYDTLYVNLWDGPVYKGRLLVAPKNRDFRSRDFLLAEVLTQRAIFLLRHKSLGNEGIYQNMDDIVFALLRGQQTEAADLARLLNLLGWEQSDRFLCLRMRSQQAHSEVMMEHLLHSDLFRCFPGSYILLGGGEQCVLVNLTRTNVQSSPAQIRHQLSPLCRDYCQYAGISAPVRGIRELQAAYYQAGAALEQTFRLRSERWILSFPECSMHHILQILPPPLTPGHLVVPELRELLSRDREKGTQYFKTFREYLLQERDIPRTSEKLIIHRTTLLYRLKKIRAWIRADLEDPWQRLHLMLSLWILEQEGETGT
ncbi:MAG: helix-turn-helix domain-containing protein [Oscillospiraceae bacterium]|nr:helix-turn-helix domain-containing protein [Oscillospiraceae bacterium]